MRNQVLHYLRQPWMTLSREIYCNNLLRQKRGVPLYIPEPNASLPPTYRRHGVALGDVGSVTSEGEFDFYFNVFLPADDPINADRTPENFFPMFYDWTDIIHHDYGPGDYLATSTVRFRDPDAPSDGEFPGGHFLFICDGPQGAVLALPDGAHLQKLQNLENIRAYAANHADSWYKHINGPRWGRGLENGDLYLITGCEKARSWGMASFRAARQEFQLCFKPTRTTHSIYRWSGVPGQINPSRRKSHDPPSINEPTNQTMFLHGLSISLGTGLWRRLFGTVTVETSSLAEFQMKRNTTSGSHWEASQGSWLSLSWNALGGSAAAGKSHAGDNRDVIFSAISPSAKVLNPAKLLNSFILPKASDFTVVLSHDDDWCCILGDVFLPEL
ncbi:hypothetical protein C8R47DRAFT_116854 [Mycena vitilis]|nr:hypothetical protein C8R47DRAFT_116854 [Mycena vitilis]